MARRPNTISDGPPTTTPPIPNMVPRQRHCFSFMGQAVNGRQVSITLPNEQNGVVLYWGNAEFWNIRGASLRGNWRHSCSEQVLKRLKKVNPDYRISTATARLLALGGVKSSGASRLMTPCRSIRPVR